MMVKIKDINVPTKGVGKNFSIKVIGLELPNGTPTFYWQVLTDILDIAESDEQPTYIPGYMILEGNLQMESEEYNQWGTDDNYVIDWALNKLNFERK